MSTSVRAQLGVEEVPRDPYSCGNRHWSIIEATWNADREEGNMKVIASHLGEAIRPID